MTELLYLNNSYLKECIAKVVKIFDDGVVLDKTIFYPQGGGQPSDTGKIIADNKEFVVEKVRKVDGEIIHFIKGSLWRDVIKENSEVKEVIDWEKRHVLMRMHTAAHVISSIFNKRAKALITGNQLDVDKSRIDFNMEDFNKDEILAYVGEANALMKQGQEISISYMPREQALEDPELVKLAKVLPPVVKELRIITIGDIDRQCDGGTHVRNTGEVGDVEIVSIENKGKNNRRVYYKLK